MITTIHSIICAYSAESWIEQSWMWLRTYRWDSPGSVLGHTAAWLILFLTTIYVLNWILEPIAKLKKTLIELGAPILANAEAWSKLEQRRQFCNVLRTDLSIIEKAESWNGSGESWRRLTERTLPEHKCSDASWSRNQRGFTSPLEQPKRIHHNGLVHLPIAAVRPTMAEHVIRPSG